MPNWVFSTLSVSGSEADISVFRSEMSKPFTTYYGDHSFNQETKEWGTTPDSQENTPVFAFWNIVSPDPADYDEYFAVQPRIRSEVPLGDPNWWQGVLDNQAVSKHWYDWNNHHWGTKWDVTSNVEILDEVDEDPTNVIYKFETAWSPVDELLVNVLSPRFPDLTFEYEYEEEQGWGGNIVFKNGEVTFSKQWDIPNAHADFKEHDWRDCYCESCPDDPEMWFADCPVDTDKYELVDNEWKEKESV